jgi:hypothetical protein
MATEAEKVLADPDSIETGWAPTALEGLRLTLDLADQKRIKIIVNGGGLNPRGLAEKTHKMVQSQPCCTVETAWPLTCPQDSRQESKPAGCLH